MSSYDIKYCNITTDLTAIEPSIDSFDRKRVLSGWVDGDADEYKIHNSGVVSVLFRDGQDLGSAEATEVEVDVDYEWYYDSAGDYVIVHDSSGASDSVYEAGEDWATLKERVAEEQAERIRSYVGRPIYSRKGVGTESASSREYDWIIIHSNAVLTCAELIRSFDFNKAKELEQMIINPSWDVRGEPSGLLDELKIGNYTLWNENTAQKRDGIAREVSIDDATTGSIVDTRGTATCDWDAIKIVIGTGGAVGTATYSTYVRNSSGLKNTQVVNDQTVSGGFDYAGHNVYIRFANGVYTADDEWELEVSGDAPDNPQIKSINLSRK